MRYPWVVLQHRSLDYDNRFCVCEELPSLSPLRDYVFKLFQEIEHFQCHFTEHSLHECAPLYGRWQPDLYESDGRDGCVQLCEHWHCVQRLSVYGPGSWPAGRE